MSPKQSALLCGPDDYFGRSQSPSSMSAFAPKATVGSMRRAVFTWFGSGTGWPDVLVAAIMASLALQGAFTVIRQGRVELQGARCQIAFPAE
jgi:hypothetical protein